MNENQTSHELMDRIAALESRCRTLTVSRYIHFLIIACLSGVTVLEYTGLDYVLGKTVSASAFLLVDANGITRASLKAEGDGANFALYDQEGMHRASMAVMGDDPSFNVYNSQGFRRASFGMTQDAPQITFMDFSGYYRSGFLWSEQNRLHAFDAKGENKKDHYAPAETAALFRDLPAY